MKGTIARSGSSRPLLQWNSILVTRPTSRVVVAPTGQTSLREPGRGGAVARTRMLVVGGDAAGMSSATQARRRRPADELEIVAFERGRHVSYSACGLPYYAGGVVKDWRDLIARTPEEFVGQDIEVRTRHEV